MVLIHRFWSGPPKPHDSFVRETIKSTLGEYPVDHSWFEYKEHRHLQPNRYSNLVRAHVLYTQGGLWLDHDVIPLNRSLIEGDQPWTAAIGRHREGSLMFFPEPEHRFAGRLLEQIFFGKETRSIAEILDEIPDPDHEVGKRTDVFTHNARGEYLGVTNPAAVHLWETSSQHLLRENKLKEIFTHE